MDLHTELHKPFMKLNNFPQYVHSQSNHPPNIIKNIPIGIERRLSAISANEEIFTHAAPVYQEALSKNGYKHQLKYNPPDKSKDGDACSRRRTRKRNILYFNPPYSKHVTTNIGKKFFALLERCFPIGHPLHKAFNKNTVKLSYSCMPNMKQIISSHNKTVLNNQTVQDPQKQQQAKECNCRKN